MLLNKVVLLYPTVFAIFRFKCLVACKCLCLLKNLSHAVRRSNTSQYHRQQDSLHLSVH